MRPRDAHLASLTAPTPVRVGASTLGEDGLFASKNIDTESVVFSDVPLAWLPEEEKKTDIAGTHCQACSAFLGSPSKQLAALTGEKKPLPLPSLADAPPAPELCAAECPRC